MSDMESMYYDSLEDEYIENIIEDNSEYVEQIEYDKKVKEIEELYQISNIPNTFTEEVELCKKLLNPIELDKMPIQRQVLIFSKLVNIKFSTHNSNYYKIISSAFSYDLIGTNLLEINTLIPKKHYQKMLDKIYNDSTIKTLQIPLDDSTEYLQELFQIWILHTLYNKTAYAIAKDDSIINRYEDKEVKRKINSIKNLIN